MKNKQRLRKAFQILGMVGMLLISYPILVLAVFFTHGRTEDTLSLGLMTTVLLLGGIGYYATSWFDQKQPAIQRWKKGLLQAVGIALVLIGMLRFYPVGTLPFRIVAAILVALAFLFGSSLSQKTETLLDTSIIATIMINMIAVAVLWSGFQLEGMHYSVSSIVVVFFIDIAIFGVVHNQVNIDRLMKRGEHRLEQLPQKIRRYNLMMILLLLGVIVCCFCFRAQIGYAIKWTAEIVRDLIVLFFWLIGWLSSLLRSSEETEMPTTQQPQIMLGNGNSSSSDWVTPVMLLILTALIIWKGKTIWCFLLSKWHQFTAWLRTLLKGKERHTMASANVEEYVDLEETVSTKPESNKKKKLESFQLWHKKYKEFCAMKDTSQKQRYGYRLLIEWLKWRKIAVNVSDTPTEILKKANKVIVAEEFVVATHDYERLRYGEQGYRVQNIQQVLNQLDSQKGRESHL